MVIKKVLVITMICLAGQLRGDHPPLLDTAILGAIDAYHGRPERLVGKVGEWLTGKGGEPLPEGPYQKTCWLCSFQENTLTCSCPDSKGSHAVSTITLKDANQWHYVDNIDGRLNLNLPLPEGKYQQACKSCWFNGETLTCSCPDSKGEYKTSNITLKDTSQWHSVDNVNGMLSFPLPQGSYQQSCQSCSFNGETLSCKCDSKPGYVLSSSLTPPKDYTGQIENLSGYLSLPLPEGSYKKKCRSCFYNGTRLSCFCYIEEADGWMRDSVYAPLGTSDIRICIEGLATAEGAAEYPPEYCSR